VLKIQTAYFRQAFAASANMVVDSAIQSSTGKRLCTMQRSIAWFSAHQSFLFALIAERWSSK
jgi:hypothetical protein